MEELLVTVHGIQSRGKWHDKVAEQLEPHFRCEQVKYGGYWPLGPIMVAALTLGVATVLVAAFLRWRRPEESGLTIVFAVGLLLIVVGAVLPIVAFYTVKRQIEEKRGDRVAGPHLVAHSFGTYLCCWTLNDYSAFIFGRMILVGCVLPLDFPWRKLLTDKPVALIEVRHEVGLKDWVVALTPVVRLTNRRVGPAGRKGFPVDDSTIHDGNAWQACSRCQLRERVPIHNFRQRSSHWIELFTKGHPREIWLPYLWGYEPLEYRRYRLLCHEGFDADRDGHFSRAKRVEQRFRREPWTWTRNLPCENYLAEVAADYYEEMGRPVPDSGGLKKIQRKAIRWIWLMHVTTEREWCKEKGQRNDGVVRMMRPEWLFEEAVKRAVT